MQAMETVTAAASASGVPLTRIGPELGKSAPYVNNTLTRGSVPRADTLAAMLSVCGYALAAVPCGDVPPSALVIDAPGAEDDDARREAARREVDRAQAALDRARAALAALEG